MIHYSRKDEILCGSEVPGGWTRYMDEVECLDCLRLLVTEGQVENKQLKEALTNAQTVICDSKCMFGLEPDTLVTHHCEECEDIRAVLCKGE